MSETNSDYSTEPYDLEEGSGEERIADPAKEQTDPENMEPDPAKKPTDSVKQLNLGNIADAATKQKLTPATSNRIKILEQNYETQAR